MGRSDYEIGSSTVEKFFYWIEERHAIYRRRLAGQQWPWTDDPIFREYKFTNAYRQLDRGTVALQHMLRGRLDLIAFNVMWYRSFNLDVHAAELGFVKSHKALDKYIRARANEGLQIFTSAHMTCGLPGERKWWSFLNAIEEMWNARQEIVDLCLESGEMQVVFERLKKFMTVGPFISYEMVCDFRFTPLLKNAIDKLTWANIGPGAKRGMLRLGFEPTVDTMVCLYDVAHDYLTEDAFGPVPFELREIEHSLCEFDKYERVRLGQGRPRQKYRRPE